MVERLLEPKRTLWLYIANHNRDTLINQMPTVVFDGVMCWELEVLTHVATLQQYSDKDETIQRTPNLSYMRDLLKAV